MSYDSNGDHLSSTNNVFEILILLVHAGIYKSNAANKIYPLFKFITTKIFMWHSELKNFPLEYRVQLET